MTTRGLLGPAETALLVPIKAFRDAKLRLAQVLPDDERRALARELASGVLSAGHDAGLPVFVVSDDHDVAAFAEQRGATVIWTPGLGLSGAVAAGLSGLARAGATVSVVSHADLPRPAGLGGVARSSAPGAVTIVPDRARNGTNVIALGTSTGFRFAYGPGSFGRHCAEAHRLGLALEVVADEGLAADVDVPADLALIGR